MLVFILLLFPCLLFAQEFNFIFEPDSIPVDIYGWQPFCPWSGGDAESCPEFADIDADGDLDLFVGNFWGYIAFYENTGTSTEPDFNFITKEYAGVDLSGNTYAGRTDPCFVDIDNDSDLDLFTSCARGLVHYWENQGSSTEANFVHITDSLEYIDLNGLSHLDFVDIDSDNDLDMFIGDYQGNIAFYENIGTAEIFDFEEVTQNFSGIDIGDIADQCFIDIDADGDYDLFVGDEDGYMHYYRNDGDSVNWDYALISDNFMGIDVGVYASPEFADLDGDGDFELFIGKDGNSGDRLGNIYYYENLGNPGVFQFEYRTKNFLIIDMGTLPTIPNLVDIDNDGLLDLFCGLHNKVYYFKNTGTLESPSFELIDETFQDISVAGVHPWFVDIDGDGDYDLLCGESVIPGPPNIRLYINRGTPEEPDIFLYNEDFITNPDFHVNAHPGCADIDADGDYDLFVTSDNENFYFYQNDGSSTWPDFNLITDAWQGISFPPYAAYWRGFCFEDIDEDDDLDLLMLNVYAEDYDNLRFYRNEGTIYSPNMVFETNVFLPDYVILHPSPSLVDIDNDHDLDLFCGDLDGGIQFFRNWGDSTVVVKHNSSSPYTFTLHPNYPNPFNAQTVIPFTLDRALPIRIAVYNQLGQEVVTLVDERMNPGTYQVDWDAGAVSSGVYLIQLETGEYSNSQKAILVK